jgi:hypothetical protein
MEQLSKYLANKNFIDWVFHQDADLEIWWNQFETDHPEEKRNIQLAKKVLLKLRTNDKELTEEEKILLFSKILRQVEARRQPGKSNRTVLVFLKYAAVAILFFSIGALLFYEKSQFNPQQLGQSLSVPVPDNSAQLIRANGENILLKDDKSILTYKADGRLLVNKDTIKTEHPVSETSTALNQLIIPYGKTSEVLLSDGTKVFLNAGSRLVYPEKFSGKIREVLLVGEAFFDVSHDQAHPFVVQVSDLRVKVLGTQFNISAYPTDSIIETVLAAGKINIEKNHGGLFERPAELVPDQLASFDKNSNKTVIRNVRAENYTIWTKGILQFESTDLLKITNRLERYYNIRFEYNEPILGNLLISGKMELKEDKEEICDRLSRAAAVKIVKKEEGLYEILK